MKSFSGIARARSGQPQRRRSGSMFSLRPRARRRVLAAGEHALEMFSSPGSCFSTRLRSFRGRACARGGSSRRASTPSGAGLVITALVVSSSRRSVLSVAEQLRLVGADIFIVNISA